MDSHDLRAPKRGCLKFLSIASFGAWSCCLTYSYYNLGLQFIDETPAYAPDDRGKSRQAKYIVQKDLGTDHSRQSQSNCYKSMGSKQVKNLHQEKWRRKDTTKSTLSQNNFKMTVVNRSNCVQVSFIVSLPFIRYEKCIS